MSGRDPGLTMMVMMTPIQRVVVSMAGAVTAVPGVLRGQDLVEVGLVTVRSGH